MPYYIESFKENGYDVSFLQTHRVSSKWNIYIRIKRRFGMDISNYMRKDAERLGQKIIQMCKRLRPDVVMDLNGFYLNEDTIDKLRKKCLVFAKMEDRLAFFPQFYKVEKFKHYDVVYTYSEEDKDIFNENGANGVFFSAKGDLYHYRSLGINRDIDIAFVGSMYPAKDYGERYDLLKKLAKDFPNLKIYVGGKCAPMRRPCLFFKWLFNKRYRQVFINKNISLEECNRIYNKSKICLNIERNNTGNIWSGRLVNIFLTNTFVLVQNDNDNLRNTFKGGYVAFDNYPSLKRHIQYYLAHEQERVAIAQKGYEILHSIIEDGETSGAYISKDIKERLNNKSNVK